MVLSKREIAGLMTLVGARSFYDVYIMTSFQVPSPAVQIRWAIIVWYLEEKFQPHVLTLVFHDCTYLPLCQRSLVYCSDGLRYDLIVAKRPAAN